jgi:hypothetical protein
MHAAVHVCAPCTGDTPEEERVLRQFDLDTRYGPCAGMTRLERCAWLQ